MALYSCGKHYRFWQVLLKELQTFIAAYGYCFGQMGPIITSDSCRSGNLGIVTASDLLWEDANDDKVRHRHCEVMLLTPVLHSIHVRYVAA